MTRRPISLAAAALLATTLGLAGLLSADGGQAHRGPQSRPIALGTSGGHIRDASRIACCSGTLGALVTDGSSQFILSNNHVMARSNKARAGDGIIQPGLVDQAPVCGGDAADVVATLWDWEPIRFLTLRTFRTVSNTVDAAIAEVVPGTVQSDGAIVDIGPISSAPAAAEIGMTVQKSGRTTGHTAGVVAATDATIIVRYGGPCGGGRGLARFANQVRIASAGFSAGGDSGALVVDDSTPPRAVGLLFAGGARDTFANPIQSVLDAFGVSLVGSSSSGQAPSLRRLAGLARAASAAHAARHPPVDPAWLAAARQARQRHEDAILARPGVVGIGVAASSLDPRLAAVEIYVRRDTAAIRRALPAWIDGIDVRVVETGEIVARAAVCPLD
jgi:hypothetical protein